MKHEPRLNLSQIPGGDDIMASLNYTPLSNLDKLIKINKTKEVIRQMNQ
jgi:hypothetical protein